MVVRRALSVVALAVAATAVALTAAEVALRVDGRIAPARRYAVGERASRPSRSFVADPHTGWRMRPRHEFAWTIAGLTQQYRSNPQGFRDERDYDTLPGEARVILIGDSFTFGTGVAAAETFGARLAAALPAGRVFNLAMPGFGLDQMWMSLRHQALPLRPSLVVVAFVDADFERALTAYRETEGFAKPRFVLDGDTVRPAGAADGPSALTRLVERTALGAAARQAAHTMARRRPIGEWWHLNAALLRAMGRDAATADVPLVVVRLPARQERRAFPALVGLARENRLTYLDLADPGRSRPGDDHFTGDGHLNARGHRFVADTLLAWLRANHATLVAGAASADRSTP